MNESFTRTVLLAHDLGELRIEHHGDLWLFWLTQAEEDILYGRMTDAQLAGTGIDPAEALRIVSSLPSNADSLRNRVGRVERMLLDLAHGLDMELTGDPEPSDLPHHADVPYHRHTTTSGRNCAFALTNIIAELEP